MTDVILVADAKRVMQKMVDGFSDALTGAAVEIRGTDAAWTSDQVADILTSLAAMTSRTFEGQFRDV